MPAQTRRAAIVALVGVASVIALLVGAWAIDNTVHSGQAMRNVDVEGTAVGGLSETDLRAVLDDLAAEAARRPVQVETPAGSVEVEAGAIGLEVDVEATASAVMAVGRGGNAVLRPFGWAASLVGGEHVDLAYVGDASAAEAALAELVEANRIAPVEPTVATVDGEVVPVAGQPGQGLDLGDMTRRLVEAATRHEPLSVRLDPVPVDPLVPDAEAEALAASANQATAAPVTVTAGGASATVQPPTLRSWVRAAVDEGEGDGPGLRLAMDPEAVTATLGEVLSSVGTPPVQLSWSVGEGGAVSYAPGTPGAGCCAADSAQRVIDALTAGTTTVALDLDVVPPAHDAAWAESMQITQPVASFTTNHACCEARVENIQRMADIVRGVVIPPGDTFSVNDFVGQRTLAKGFKEAGVIYHGEFTTDVGGGVSQFATTLFNAAFFAGLEIPEYMAHTIYISRYPYGREATLSYPDPDLAITNNTPFGILLWPTYTGSSITVTLYSSPWITAEQTGQSQSPAGACTRVTTQRTRTWLVDGRTEVDTVHAIYQPEEGVLC